MKKITNDTQVVVIFERDDTDPSVSKFHPVKLISGYMNKEKKCFIADDGTEYKYFFGTKDKYGYGLRTDIYTIKKNYKALTTKQSINIYFSLLEKKTYYIAVCDDNDLHFVCEDELGNIIILDGPEFAAFLKSRLKKGVRILKKELEQITNKKINTKQLSNEVKEHVLAQDKAIDTIVTILWENSKSDIKQNMLVIGPTGVGKTEIFRQIAKKIEVPLVEVNMAEFTKTGYRGQSIDDILVRLIHASGDDVQKAEHGFVILDEIDKKASGKEFGENIGSSSVQDELLKLIEDGTFQINLGTDIAPNLVEINTKNITFIGLGAFSELFEDKSNKIKEMGFLVNNKKENINEKKGKNITNEDLVAYGLKPELIGRFRNVIELNPLSKENLIQIMKNPHDKILQDKINILNKEKIEVEINESVYSKIADNAIKKHTGARGLHSELDNLFRGAMREISQNEGIYQKLIINEETVDNPEHYTLVRKK